MLEVGTGSLVDIQSANEGEIPRVSVQTTENGILGYFDESIKNARYFENFISVNFFGISYYHPYRASVEMKVHTLKLKNRDFITSEGIFISAMINKRFDGLFSYGSQLSSSKLKNNDFKIQLPIKNGEIDFDFMESFIEELEAERIAELDAYLLATGLKNYTLTAEEQQVLDDFEKVEWASFKIGDLFEKLNLKNHNKSFYKQQDTSPTKTNEFNLPLVNAKFGDNGIMFYGREKDFDSAEMTIDIISNGAIATGTVYAQPYKTGVLWDAYLLKPQVIDVKKEKLLFFTTALEKSIKMKFGWDNKAVWSKVQHELFSLPIQNHQPDYTTMNTFISAIQKLVIKDVVLYTNKKVGI